MTVVALQPSESPVPHRFTRDEYYQMGELGFFRDRRVELIEGEIIDMDPQKNTHFMTINLVARALSKIFDENEYWIRAQGPLNLGRASDPEPDVAVVRGAMGSHSDHPNSAILIVEVSDTTLLFDRTEKASLYARAGIADYWIINVSEKCVEVMRDPMENASGMYGYKYKTLITLRPPEVISPLGKPAARIPVAELLP